MAIIKSFHVLVVVLFLALTAYKVVLLLLNKTELLQAVQKRTRIFDVIFGILLLATGLYLAFALDAFSQIWLLVKLVMVAGAIPLAIIGLKKQNKGMAIGSVLLLIAVYTISETKIPQSREGQKTAHQQVTKRPEQTPETPQSTLKPKPTPGQDASAVLPAEILTQLDDNTRDNAAQLYTTLCARCHGLDGEPVFPGAPNLKELTCPKRAITGTIYSGRGDMPSFANVLTRQEISRLADYVEGMQQP